MMDFPEAFISTLGNMGEVYKKMGVFGDIIALSYLASAVAFLVSFIYIFTRYALPHKIFNTCLVFIASLAFFSNAVDLKQDEWGILKIIFYSLLPIAVIYVIPKNRQNAIMFTLLSVTYGLSIVQLLVGTIWSMNWRM